MAAIRPLLVFALLAAALAACDVDATGSADATVTPDATVTTDASDTEDGTDVEVPVEGLQLTSVDPAAGSIVGLDEVQLHGHGLSNVTTVLFGESQASDVFAVSDRLLVALTPARPETGVVDVTVIDDLGDAATLEDAFAYRTDVIVTEVSPGGGHWLGGDAITVHGSGFSRRARVIIGGRAAPIVDYVDSGTLTAVSPAGEPGLADVFVSTDDGVGELRGGFLFQGAPVIHSVTPAVAPVAGGVTVDIAGVGFVEPLEATIGGRELTDVTVLSSALLRGVVPAAAVEGPADVVVTASGGTAVASGAFHYMDDAAGSPLTLLSVHPPRGSVAGGQRVALAVVGLAGAGAVEVTVGGRPATVIGQDAGGASVIAEIPAAALPGPATVVVREGGDESALPGGFLYVAGARVNGVSPDGGPVEGGTAVTITGDGFAPGAAVRFGALAATGVRVVDGQRIEVVTPPGAPGPVAVRVLQDGAIASLEDAFTYDGPPAVWLVDPPRGSVAGGTQVVVHGHGFARPGVNLFFGAQPAVDVVVLSDSRVAARTPPGDVGPVAVSVRGGGVDASHPSAFAYFDPASLPGTWGGPVVGSVNVTVIDGRSGMRVPNAYVTLGPEHANRYSGFTDVRGQITFSGPDVQGDQSVTAGAPAYGSMQVAGFDATNVTVVLDPVPTCASVGDVPCDQIIEPGPVAFFNGTIVGATKGPTAPFGLCADWADDPEGLCAPCTEDLDCAGLAGGSGACGALADEGFFCSHGCDVDLDCGGDFICLDPTGEDKQRRCVPPPGEAQIYCDITNPDAFSDDAIDWPGVRVAADNTVRFQTRLGNYAVFCWRGLSVRGQFRPEMLGVTRHLGAFVDREEVHAEIRLDTPLPRKATMILDRPPMGPNGASTTTVRAVLELGGDGVLDLPPIETLPGGDVRQLVPGALTGDLYDAQYTVIATVEVPAWQAQSNLIEGGLAALDSTRDLRLDPDEGWVFEAGARGTTRAIAGHDGELWVAGDRGRVQKSFGVRHWAEHDPGTDRDLHAVAVYDADNAVVVGVGGVASHWDGLVWKAAHTGTLETLVAVVMPAADVAFAAGGDRVMRWEAGAGWAQHAQVDGWIRALWAADAGELWAVGDGGLVLRGDGATWTPVDAGVTADLRAVWGDGQGLVVAVGRGGAVVVWDGVAWTRETVPVTSDLNGVWGESGERVWVVGARGAILERVGGAWLDRSRPDHRATLRAVGGSGGKVWAMGSHELVLGPMVAIPEEVVPANGGFLGGVMRWTVPPSVEPDFSVVDFGSAAGPCEICEMLFMIPFTEWRAVLDGDLNEAVFPHNGTLPGGGGFGWGGKEVVVYRAIVDDGFDFDESASNGFFGAGWRAWSVRPFFFLR